MMQHPITGRYEPTYPEWKTRSKVSGRVEGGEGRKGEGKGGGWEGREEGEEERRCEGRENIKGGKEGKGREG